ncbi:MAG TPA: serine/threonine-protein kinase, partial [Polyangiaceae bacterium]|nr:serine/threonine-protein kinase [Polyangiaceae bacterium]
MSDSAESWELTQGALINGKYRIERVIGRGAMGLVLAATDLRLGRRVALKFLLPAVASNPELRARFTREAQSAARLRNQHVVSIFGVEESGEGQPFIVMEYLDGEDLATLLARRGRLPVDAAVEYVLQTCEALSEAHALGIVHRDLKPANLFLTRHPDGSPWIKVCDFGIAKSAFGDTPHLTKTGEFIGTPQYSAPEQLRSSGAVDQRADIWSLGAILFEMLAGRPPFQGHSLQHLAAQVCHTDPPELGGVRPDVPVGLRQVVSSCLRRDLDSRVLDVAEVAERLRPYAPP